MAVGTTLGAINVIFGADTSGLASGIKGATDLLGGFGSAALGVLGGVGVALGAVGAAAIGVGVASTIMAGNFQQQINRLVTGAGDVTDNMKAMGASIMDISVATGQMTTPLNAAMYLILSSGQRGAEALNTLKVAAEGAAIEQANVGDVANVVSGLMTNYGTNVFNATQYMNGMITAVKHGKITLEQLATAMGPIDPIAKEMGISVNDVAAAMTTQTNAMVPYERAATGLRFLMQSLEVPTHKATAAMQEYGLNTVAVADEMKKSLPGALQMIYDAAKRAGPEGSVPFVRALSDMVGGMRAETAFAALTGEHMKDFVANSKEILKAMQQNKDAVIGWSTASAGFNVQMDMATASVNALFITMGQYLLPVLTSLLQQITPTIQAITDWITQSGILQSATDRLTSFLGACGQAFNDVFNPIKKTYDAIKPLTDTFDHASGIIHATAQVVAPLSDAFDRASGVLHATSQAVAPLSDTFDRASGIIASSTVHVQDAVPPWIQFWQGIKHVWDTLRAVDWGGIGQHFNDFATAVGKVDWGGVGAGFQRISDALVHVDWGKVGKSAGEIALAFMNVDWGKVGNALSGMMDSLGKVDWKQVTTGIKEFSTNLGKVDWGGILGALKNVGDGISMIGFIIHLTLGPIFDGLQTIIKMFQALADSLVTHSIIPDMINRIVALFTGLPGRLMGAIASLPGMIVGFFSNLASIAYNGGANIMQQVANGIQSAFGYVVNAVGGITNWIAANLPHSPAKIGPLRDLEHSGAMITQQLSTGMLSAMPKLQMSMNALLQPIITAPVTPASAGGAYRAPVATSGGVGGKRELHIHVEIGGREYAHHIVDDLGEALVGNMRLRKGLRY